MYLCDFHTHSLISHDSQTPLADMVWAAARAGLAELCVTDHCDLLDGDGQSVDAFPWPDALAQYRWAKEGWEAPALRLGIELGSIPHDPDAARHILAQAGEELDFVLGSLHNWIGVHGNRDLYFTDFTGDPALCRQAVENCLDNTWDLVTQYSDCYDSLAHIVYPLRYVHRDGQDLTLAPYEEQVRAIFTEVARTDHALEVNTYRGTDMEPWPTLLAWFKECGGRYVTLGSDAHQPSGVGGGIPEALAMLEAAGFSTVTTFVRRRPVEHPLG